MKTRLQSSDGFWRTGGFRGIYSGVSSAAAGSMPTGPNPFSCRVMKKALDLYLSLVIKLKHNFHDSLKQRWKLYSVVIDLIDVIDTMIL